MSVRIPNFEFSECIYEGDATQVYAGLRLADQVPVVAKLASGGLRDLRHEHGLAVRVAGPGVVESLGIFDSSDGPVMVQRRFGDGTVADTYKSGPVPTLQALQITSQLVSVLRSLHGQRILHRDIKPANLLYDSRTQQIAVADFGIAVELPVGADSVAVTDLMGTPAYVAPEQTGRMSEGCDGRSDLYSTGILLYQLLTGTLPFESDDLAELIAMQLSHSPVAPCEVNPAIPAQVSAITMKLMAKLPGSRYQSAKGLEVDLGKCIAALQAGAVVPEFELGQSDVLRPVFPAHLYGRMAQFESIQAAHARANRGKPELALLVGRAGSGRMGLIKSMLSGEPQTQFAQGTCQEDDRPLGAIGRALTGLAERWLLLDDDALESVRNAALAGVGQIGQVLLDIAPALETVLGEQPPLPELGPAQARARVRHAFRSFLAALAVDKAFVFGIGDMELADAATLDLIDAVLTTSEETRVLMALAASDTQAFAPFAEHSATTTIDIGPLAEPDVTAWTAATLKLEREEVSELAKILLDKSGGNPGMLIQLVSHFVDIGAIDRENGAYCWDLETVRKAQAPKSLGAMVADRVADLSEEQVDLLCALAAHEDAANAETLAAMLASDAQAVVNQLGAVEREGLVSVQDAQWSVTHPAIAKAARQAAPEQRLASLLGRLATHLFDTCTDSELEAQSHRVAAALSGGAVTLSQHQRGRAARVYRVAAAKAASLMAYSQAADCCVRGLDLLGEHGFSGNRELFVSLTNSHCRALMMMQRNEEAERIFESLCKLDLSPEEVGVVYPSRIDNQGVIMCRDRAIELGLEGLARLGVHLPANPEIHEPFPLILENEAKLAQLSNEQLLDMPYATDPVAIATIRIISTTTIPTALAGRKSLNLLLIETSIATVLKHGKTRYTASFIVTHGFVMHGALKNYAAARRVHQAALQLEEAQPAPEVGARTYLVMGYFLAGWFDEPKVAVEALGRGIRLGAEAGDLVFAAMSASASVTMMMMAGYPLEKVVGLLESHSGILKGDGGVWANAENIMNICGKLSRAEAVTQADLDRVTTVPLSAGAMRNNAMVNLGITLTTAGHGDQVRVWNKEIAQLFPLVNFAQPHFVTLRFNEGWLAALDAHGGKVSRIRVTRKIVRELKQLQVDVGVLHHTPAIALLEAEVAWFNGNIELANGKFGTAVAEACARDMLQFMAIGNERRSEMLAANGAPEEAALFRRQAHLAYKRWGHMTKASEMELAYPELKAFERGTGATGASTGRTVSATSGATLGATTTAVNDALDLTMVLKVSQEISTQLHAPEVVRAVLAGIAQNAGADRALLVLNDRDGTEQVCGEVASGKYIDIQCPLAEYTDVPQSIVRIVRRTKRALVIANASADEAHQSDEFVARVQCRSVACIPIIGKSGFSGFVILENRLLAGAFTPQLLDVARALVAQAAISLDNASLYQDMEARVADRTAALNARNAQMRVVLDNVSQGLVVVDRDGKLGAEQSAILGTWFDGDVPDTLEGLFAADDHAAMVYEIGWEQLLDGFLPAELCIDQLPQEMTLGGRILSFGWQPLTDDAEELQAMLVVISDVTEVRRREQEEQQQKQLMAMFTKISADRGAVVEFIDETQELVNEISEAAGSEELEKRLVHTLKGNTAIFGLKNVSSLCHGMEDAMELDGRRLTPEERAEIASVWAHTRSDVDGFLEAGRGYLQVRQGDYDALLGILRRDEHFAAVVLEQWQAETLRDRFTRTGDQAITLANRLGKGPVEVEYDDGGYFLNHDSWGAFWSAFVHAVRNAIDHGLEPAAERAEQGKGNGTLSMRGFMQGEHFVFEFADDGRGVAWERIRVKAAAAGMPSETAEDLVAAMFSDGISSKDSADEMSGRGVGMAALAEVVEAMGAKVTVHSVDGQGTTFRYVFPADVVTAPAQLPSRISLSA